MRCDIAPLGQKYRGIARNLTVTHFPKCKSKASFEALLEVYFNYINLCGEVDQSIFINMLDCYRRFCAYGIHCEVIVYAACPIENVYGYAVELLGIDITHELCESLIADNINPNIQYLLNENGLCRTIEDLETIIPVQDHGNVDWQPCYVYSVILP